MRQTFLLFTLIVLSLLSCEDKNTDTCIDEGKISDSACIEIYDPVCGCNNKTYSNSCYAGISGLNNWTKGECK